MNINYLNDNDNKCGCYIAPNPSCLATMLKYMKFEIKLNSVFEDCTFKKPNCINGCKGTFSI